MSIKIRDIIRFLDENSIQYLVEADPEILISGFSSLTQYKSGTITWIKSEDRYKDYYTKNKDTIVPVCAVVKKGISIDICNKILTDDPRGVFFLIVKHFWGREPLWGDIGAGTVISKSAVIDKTVTIGCNCCIIGDIEIGEHTIIEHNVVIQGNVKIGKNCHIQSGTVIGIDGFGFIKNEISGKRESIDHFGGILIGDDVFIGSHTNIARGTIDNTFIGDGVKIAPSTHIGHNNTIGEDTVIICSTIYGSASIGSRTYITDSTVSNQTSIGNDTVIGMGSLVNKPIDDNVIAYGIPAKAVRKNDSTL